MLASRQRVVASPAVAFGDESERGANRRAITGLQRRQAERRLLYGILVALLLISYAAIGKDILHNPVKYAVFISPYDEYYNRLRYLTILIIFGVTLLERRAAASIGRVWHIAPLLGVAIASVAWSSDVVITARSALLLSGLVVGTAMIIDRIGVAAFFRIQLHFLALIMLASAFAAIALPDIGRHSPNDILERGHIGQWRGIFSHKNGLGAYAAIATVQLFLFVRPTGKTQAYWWAARGAAVACLLLAGSATSVTAAVVGFLFYLLLRNRHTSHPFILSILAGLVVVVAGALSAGLADILGLFGRDVTLTGRTQIWATALEMIDQHLWLGLGYGSHVNVMMDYLRTALFSSAVDTHNGYLDVLAAVGLIGFICFLLAVIVSIGKAYSVARRATGQLRDIGLASACTIVMSLTVGMGEVSPFRAVGYGGALFWMSMVLAACAQHQLLRAKPADGGPAA